MSNMHRTATFGNFLSTLSKSLQLPIAVLPMAGILLRLGQNDLLGAFGPYGQFLAGGANAIFGNLPLIFAVALAFGFSSDSHGSAALAGAVGYLVLTGALANLAPDVNIGILGGIVIGVTSGILYNRFSHIELPPYLAFFGGRRFVPIMAALAAVFIAVVFSFIWPAVQKGVNIFGQWITGSGNIGLFFYGFFNRMLLPLGLHTILNTVVWFEFGEYTNASGQVVTGEIARYLSGDPTAGYFMAGFFPVMMFGLPAACLAMLNSVKKENRAAVTGIFVSLALTSLITGVTEPVEFSFMFLAFPLYVIHAVLTGLGMVIMHMLHVRLGFTFSAGMIDFFLNAKYGAETQDTLLFGPALWGYGNILWGLIIGLVYGIIYYVLFRLVIHLCDLKTQGREVVMEEQEMIDSPVYTREIGMDTLAKKILRGLGGSENIKNVDACTTRLRVEIVSNDHINEALLKEAGAMGVMNKVKGNVQVVVGTNAPQISDAVQALLDKD